MKIESYAGKAVLRKRRIDEKIRKISVKSIFSSSSLVTIVVAINQI